MNVIYYFILRLFPLQRVDDFYQPRPDGEEYKQNSLLYLKRLKARSITIGPICCDWKRMCRVASISSYFHSENIKGLTDYRNTARRYTPQVSPKSISKFYIFLTKIIYFLS